MTPNEIIKAMDELAVSNSDLYDGERDACEKAAALIREMREMMTVMNNSMLIRGGRCVWCDNHTGHAPDCKLAQMLKD